MLPPIEVDNLVNAVFEALDLAAEGHVADGHGVLRIGKQKALDGEANFEPWAEARGMTAVTRATSDDQIAALREEIRRAGRGGISPW